MSILKIADFNKLLELKKIYPVYLFAGEETYFIDGCLKALEKVVSIDSLNKEVHYISESSVRGIINALSTLPFLSEKRLIIVKDVDSIKVVDACQLVDYLSNVVETSILVLLYKGNYKKETISKRKELINSCISSKDCISVDCRKLYENEVKIFIENEFNFRRKTVSQEIIQKIIENNGLDLLSIMSEVEKICLYAGKNKKEISQEDLNLISGYTQELNIYFLSSCIESKDLEKALFVLNKLLTQGEEPVIILSVISSCIRKLLNAKSMIEESSMQVVDVMSKLKIHNFYSGAFFANLKKHSTKRLLQTLKKILNVDVSIKTSSSDVYFSLEKLIIYICI